MLVIFVIVNRDEALLGDAVYYVASGCGITWALRNQCAVIHRVSGMPDCSDTEDKGIMK